MDLASVIVASNWLTTRTLPFNEHGFAHHKSAFHMFCLCGMEGPKYLLIIHFSLS